MIYFEACLTQMRQGDFQLLLIEGLLGISWSKLDSYHVSWPVPHRHGLVRARNATGRWRGAALEYEAQVMEKLLALTLKAAKDLHRENCKALLTFKSPKQGSFKSNAQV